MIGQVSGSPRVWVQPLEHWGVGVGTLTAHLPLVWQVLVGTPQPTCLVVVLVRCSCFEMVLVEVGTPLPTCQGGLGAQMVGVKWGTGSRQCQRCLLVVVGGHQG